VYAVTVNGEAVEPSDSYMFENVSADAALHVEFAKIGAAPSGDVFRITLHTGEGGAAALDGAPEDIFTHAAELREMGLGIPGAAALAEELRARGAAVPQGIYTPHDLAAALLARKEGGAC